MAASKELTKGNKLIRDISLACILLAACEAHAQDPKLSVDYPFATQLTHDNMCKCDGSYSAYYPSLSRIASYSYVFSPAKGGTGKPNGPNVDQARTIIFTMPEISRSKIYGLLHSMDRDSCDTDVQVSNTNFAIPDPLTATVSYHVDTASYDCGWFLGVHYKNWQASAHADVKIDYGFNDQLELIQRGEPQVSNLTTSSNWTYDVVLGLLLPFPVGTAIAVTLKQAVVSKLASLRELHTPSSMLASLVGGVKTLKEYTTALDLSEGIALLTNDPTASGLTPNEVDHPTFKLVQRQTLGSVFGRASYINRVGEIALLKDLSIPSPRLYTVKKGDNLWKISKRTYDNSKMYLLLEDTNHLRHKKLKVGSRIILPLLYEICDKTENENEVVQALDSVSKLRARIGSEYHPPARQFTSGNLDLIYPWEATGFRSRSSQQCK